MKKSTPNVFAIKPAPSKDGLRYLHGIQPGITRKKKGDKWYFYDPEGKRITDTDELNRIKALVIPPAWQDVWISPFENSHLQATGIDAKGRKQYRYHQEWNKKRSETKFSKLGSFAKTIPLIREKVEIHLRQRSISREKVIAIIIDIMSRSYIRIGNTSYAKENGSFGLTTLRDRHVNIRGDSIKFSFKGKKGVMHDIELHDKRLARLVKSCKDIPGHELFQYFDSEGNRHVIDSGDINGYLHEVCGDNFSAKDFRTWAGTFHAFKALVAQPVPGTQADFKRATAEVFKEVSRVLGNTPAVCRKYHVHPALLESFGTGQLIRFYEERRKAGGAEISAEEDKVLLEFLETLASL